MVREAIRVGISSDVFRQVEYRFAQMKRREALIVMLLLLNALSAYAQTLAKRDIHGFRVGMTKADVEAAGRQV
jgi:hypothetical protein